MTVILGPGEQKDDDDPSIGRSLKKRQRNLHSQKTVSSGGMSAILTNILPSLLWKKKKKTKQNA